ncbi:glycerol-3-phosphate 1-O-acyltransferase PlsY [Croceicoccus hydrothermalis]|uniref:glycerol-3-phosphate 1-O-acyltransferase PlsY n=1 Tax=Croceicoccus hydrothermalis TaxID=2867964 RepID=UPI001EFBAE3F|nr:glycerol-3-phosphate 1-O-acyltransferase PlsY [Croceicoccus hydrothermalis]
MSEHAIFAAAFGYLLGSIPWGIVLTRMTGAGNLREIGSGSTGATNVLRTGRKGLAAATLLLDLLKGLCAVVIAGAIWPDGAQFAAVGAVAGHCYPIWLRFNGGKGVATMMGVVLGLAWPLGLVFAVVWLGLLALLRISSVAGMSAAISAPLAAWALGYSGFVVAGIVMAAIVVWRHRSNLARLMAGSEPRVGRKDGSR